MLEGILIGLLTNLIWFLLVELVKLTWRKLRKK